MKHRARQLEERLKAGPEHCVDHDFVFTTYTVIRNRWGVSTIGSPLNCRSVLALWHLLLTRAGHGVRSFHAARHSVASLLIQHKGTKLEQILMLLGHSRVEITVDTYGHLVEQISAAAALDMEAMIGQHAATPPRGHVVPLRKVQQG